MVHLAFLCLLSLQLELVIKVFGRYCSFETWVASFTFTPSFERTYFSGRLSSLSSLLPRYLQA